jgi:hypothetical protein
MNMKLVKQTLAKERRGRLFQSFPMCGSMCLQCSNACDSLKKMFVLSLQVIADHQMSGISFASGGDAVSNVWYFNQRVHRMSIIMCLAFSIDI